MELSSCCELRVSERVQGFHAQSRLQPGRGSVVGRTALEKTVIHVTDTLADPEFTFVRPPNLRPSRTLLGVPLIREGTLIGVMGLARPEVKPFNDKQIELAADLRRSGGDRDREHAAVRGGAAAHARAYRSRWSSRRPRRRCSRLSAALPAIFSRCLQPCWRTPFGSATPSSEISIGWDGDALRPVAATWYAACFAEAGRRRPHVIRTSATVAW